MFSCYRKDEAHDPEIYCAAVAATLNEFDKPVIDRVTDPRCGIASEMKFLPAVAEIRSFCVREARRKEIMALPNVKRETVRFEPITKEGQITYPEFLARVNGKDGRPIGAWEPGGYLGPKA